MQKKHTPIHKSSTFLYVFLYLGSVIIAFFVPNIVQSKKINQNLKSETSAISSSEVAKSFRDQCKKTPKKNDSNNQSCYAKLFGSYAQEYGYEKSAAVLTQAQKIDKDTFTACHLISHNMGAGIYRNNKEDWRDVIAKLPPECGEGILHGLIGEYLYSLPEKKAAEPSAYLDICLDSSPLGCYHAIGHVLNVENTDNMDNAVNTCMLFPTSDKRENCLKGMFMESVTPFMSVQHGLLDAAVLTYSGRLDDLIAVCRKYSYDTEVFTQCWGEMADAALSANKFDAQKTLDVCNSTTSQQAAAQCRKRAVQEFAASSGDLDTIKSVCDTTNLNDPEFKSMCYMEIASVTAGNTPIQDVGKVVDYCMKLEVQYRKPCIEQVGDALKRLAGKEPAKRAQVCERAPDPYKGYCFTSAHVVK